MKAKIIFVIIITVLITIILTQNADEVKFTVLFWDLYLPKLVIMTGVIFLGIILGMLLASRPSKPKSVSDDYNTLNINNQTTNDTLSREDRDYISE